MGILRSVLVATCTLALAAWLLPGVVITSWVALVLAGATLALVEAIIKPILKLLFLPITVVTLGLFSIVINVLVLMLVTYLVPGFRIEQMTLFGTDLSQFFSYAIVSFALGLAQRVLSKVV